MRILRYLDPGFATAIASLQRRALPDPGVEQTVREIIGDVRREGDAALFRYTARFGGPQLTARKMRSLGAGKAAPAAAKAIAAAHRNVRDFALRSLRTDWQAPNRQGGMVGERFDPFQRVGIYVPGGTAPLVSTAVMTVTLAAAAGVPEIVVATPANAQGRVNAALLHAVRYCGATEVYPVGGAQAVAALAFGTATMRPVQKIFGPGNAYVVEAKRQVFGQVAIDLLPGPSEILVLADASAHAAWVAADLLAQAEHGHGSSILLLTDSPRLLEGVQEELDRQLKTLSRQEALAGVLAKNCVLVLVPSLAQGVALANDFAPEHISIVAKKEQQLATQIRTAGAIFLGGYSPVAAGDFVAGPSHTLPTGGAGRSFPGLTVDMFQRRTSVVRFEAAALRKSLPVIAEFSALEGLDAHGRSASIRFEK